MASLDFLALVSTHFLFIIYVGKYDLKTTEFCPLILLIHIIHIQGNIVFKHCLKMV